MTAVTFYKLLLCELYIDLLVLLVVGAVTEIQKYFRNMIWGGGGWRSCIAVFSPSRASDTLQTWIFE